MYEVLKKKNGCVKIRKLKQWVNLSLGVSTYPALNNLPRINYPDELMPKEFLLVYAYMVFLCRLCLNTSLSTIVLLISHLYTHGLFDKTI